MRYIRMCVVMICVVTSACFLSFIAKQKTTKKEKARQEKILTFDSWKEECAHKIASDDAPEWMMRQIASDLSVFMPSGFTSRMLDEVMHKNSKQGQLLRVSILDNHASIIDQGSIHIPQRIEAMMKALKILSEIARLPDGDFIFSLEDAIDGVELDAPVLAFAKHTDSEKVILIPDFEALSKQCAQLLDKVEQGIEKFPWKKKVPKAFWRGATTGTTLCKDNFLSIPRSQAVKLSLEHPSLIDARFTHLVQCKDPEQVKQLFASYFSEPSSVTSHLKYKYQLLIDGNTCAYSRAYWQLFSNCAILKQTSPNIQWFYSLLKPYVHYIPLHNDLSDLPEKILWSKDHDKEVQQIIRNAQALANENLKQADIYYYFYLALNEYAKLKMN
jgi:Glycosyl transferase family 90